MADSFNIKQNDTYPNLVAVLKENGVIVDLTNAEEVWLVLSSGFKEECTILDAEAGEIMYDWTLGETDIAGQYQAEFEVVWPQGTQTFPNNTYFMIIITPDLG